MHVLRVAGINHGNGIAFNYISVIPFVGIRHVIACPSADGRLATWKCTFNSVDVKDCIADITLHVFIRIGMPILQSYVPVESPDVPYRLLGITILILHPSCHI